jgi:hypothetical protein
VSGLAYNAGHVVQLTSGKKARSTNQLQLPRLYDKREEHHGVFITGGVKLDGDKS